MTREEARAARLKRYLPDRPCLHGHAVERYVGNNDCVECSRIRAQQYAENNRERSRQKAAEWRAANPERHRQNAINAHRRNPEAYRRRARDWARDNPERVKERSRREYEANKHTFKQRATAWAKANPRKRTEIMAANRAQRNNAKIPLSPEHQVWMRQIYENCPEGYQVDHIYPINHPKSSGLHVPWNLQYLPARDNASKSNKLPDNPRGYAFEFPLTGMKEAA